MGLVSCASSSRHAVTTLLYARGCSSPTTSFDNTSFHAQFGTLAGSPSLLNLGRIPSMQQQHAHLQQLAIISYVSLPLPRFHSLLLALCHLRFFPVQGKSDALREQEHHHNAPLLPHMSTTQMPNPLSHRQIVASANGQNLDPS